MIELGNSQVFLTKVWGYEPENYPFLGFSEDGRRSSYMLEAAHGDWLIVTGTKQDPTVEEEQGRLLGLVQLGLDPLDSLEILKEIGSPIEDNQYNSNGSYKWPYALPFLKAYKFADKPDCKDIFGEYLPGYYWATNAVNLEGKFERSLIEEIFRFKLIETKIHEIPALRKAQIFSQNLRGSRNGPTGPPPSHSRSGSDRVKGRGYTYALKLIGRSNDAFKIGCASNLKERLAELNRELRPSVTGCHWKIIWMHEFENEDYAYNFEQLLHAHFKDDRFEGETEIFKSSENTIQSIWAKIFAEKRWVENYRISNSR